MNIIDSSGWLEYFADGPNASFFSRPLQKTDNQPLARGFSGTLEPIANAPAQLCLAVKEKDA